MSIAQGSGGHDGRENAVLTTPHEAYWHNQRVKLTKGAAFNNTNVEVRVAKDTIVEGRLVVLGTLLVEGVVTAGRIVLGGPERRLENQGPVHTTPKGSWAVLDQVVRFEGAEYRFGEDLTCLSSGGGLNEYLIKGDLMVYGNLKVTHLTASGHVSIKGGIRCPVKVIKHELSTADKPRD